MPNYLPPVVVEILGKADQLYSTLGKVQAEAAKTAERVIAEAKRQAEETAKAAEVQAKAAQKAADAAAAAADKVEVATKKRIEAEQKLAAATEKAEGEATAAVERAQAALDKAVAQEEAARAKQAKAAQTAADEQAAADAKASEADKARTGIAEAESAKRKALLDRAAKESGKAGMIGLASVALVTAASGEMAAKFEQSTTKLVTSAGESENAIGDVRQGILDISSNIGVSADELSGAMYKVESAGYHSAAGLGVLKAATEGAKAEGADATNVADALSSALRDYYPHAQSAADVTAASTDVMSKFIGATSAGKMTFDELAGSLNSILPVSSAAHISLSDTMGVLASMTVHGISAQQATQNMADAIRHLQAPTQQMSKYMATLGIDSTDVAQKLGERGLSGTMQYLSEKVKAAMPAGTEKVIIDLGNALSKSTPQVQELGQKLMDGSITLKEYNTAAKDLDPIAAGQAMSFATLAKGMHQIGNQQLSGAQVLQTYGGMMQKVMGDATGLKVALMTTGENADYTNNAIKTVSGSTADADGKVKGYAESQNTLATNLDKAKASIANAAIALGTSLAPAIKVVADVAERFANWAGKNPQLLAAIVGAVAALSAGLLVFAGVMAIVNLVTAPYGITIMLIIVAIGLLVAAITWLIMNWGTVVKFLTTTWNGFVGWLKGSLNGLSAWWNQVWGGLVNWVASIWNGFTGWFKSTMDGFANWWNQTWNGLTGFVKDTWNGFTGWFKSVMDGFASWWRSWWDPFAAVVAAVWNVIVYAGKVAVTAFGTLVITPIRIALNLLGAAFDWLYKNAIKPAWDGIVTASHTAWTWLDQNVLTPIKVGLRITGDAFMQFWNGVIVPVWQGIQHTMATAWNWLMVNVNDPLALFFRKTVPDAFNWLLQQVRNVWNGIMGAISAAWNWIVSNVVNAITQNVKAMGDQWNWLQHNVIEPVWNGIRDAISTAWNWIVTNVSTAIHQEIDGWSNIFNWLWKNVINPVWQGIQDAIGNAWTWISHNVFDPIHSALDGLGKSFDSTASWIGQAWDKIKSAASGPVHFIVDNVYTNGIEKTWNDIASSVGLDLKLPDVKLGFATGGIMPGWSPGVDNQLIAVSGGESIMRPEWTRAIGAENVHAMNAMARSGNVQGIQQLMGLSGFADGGIADTIGSIAGGVGNFVTSVAGHIGDFLTNPAKAIGDMIKAPVDALKGQIGGGSFGQMVFQFPEKVIGGLIDKAKSLVAGVIGGGKSGGGAVGSPGAVSGDLASWIATAMQATGVSGGNWLNGLETIAMHESGGNPNATNNWDSNAAMGDPSRGIMQTIGSTFEGYRLQSLPDNIFDPVANIAAGIKYITSRYGDISNVPGLVSMAHGGAYQGYATGGVVPTLYDNGGWLPQGLSVVRNETGRPEPVFTGAQFDAMRQGSGSRVQNVTVHAVTNASPQAIASEVGWALRNLS